MTQQSAVSNQPAPTEFEYLRVEVTREQATEIYLKVPIGWRPVGRAHRVLGRAAKATTERSDWDDFGWEHTVTLQTYSVIDKKEAERYPVYEVVPEPAPLGELTPKAPVEPSVGNRELETQHREMRSLLLRLHSARVAMNEAAVIAALDEVDAFFREPNVN